MPKLSALPNNTAPALGDLLSGVQSSNTTDVNVTISNIMTVMASAIWQHINNPYKFNVYWANGQASYLSTAAQNYIVKFDTEDFDTGNNFNDTTYLFTAPIAGYYQFEYGISADNGASNGWVNTQLVKNGNVIVLQTQDPCTSNQPNTMINASKLVMLNAGDTMQVNAACNIGGIGVDGGDSVTYFSGFLVSAT